MEDEDNLPPQGEEAQAVEQPAEQQAPEPEQKPEPERAAEAEQDPDEPKRRPRRRHDAESRIAHLTAEIYRERQEKEELARRLAVAQESGLTASESSLTAELSKAEMDYERARNEGDVKAERAAMRRVAQLEAELGQVKSEKLMYAAPERQEPQRQPQPQQPPQPSARMSQWATDNDWWFNKDPGMTRVAMEAHQAAVNRGIVPESAEYFSLIDKRVRSQFPGEFEEEETQTPATQHVARPRV